MLEPAIFKAYDVRGLYGQELDEEGAYAIARAYVEQFDAHRIASGLTQQGLASLCVGGGMGIAAAFSNDSR